MELQNTWYRILMMLIPGALLLASCITSAKAKVKRLLWKLSLTRQQQNYKVITKNRRALIRKRRQLKSGSFSKQCHAEIRTEDSYRLKQSSSQPVYGKSNLRKRKSSPDCRVNPELPTNQMVKDCKRRRTFMQKRNCRSTQKNKGTEKKTPLLQQGETTRQETHWSELGLFQEHKEILQSQEWLDDTIIDAAQSLLKRQFHVDGLQSTVLSQVFIQPVMGLSAQIHYDPVRHHWFTSCYRTDKVEIADSMTPSSLSPAIQKQLCDYYGSVLTEPLKTVTFLNVEQQPNYNDCGVYAIANAFELLTPNGDPTCRYNNKKMRSHLIACLENGQISEFPKIP